MGSIYLMSTSVRVELLPCVGVGGGVCGQYLPDVDLGEGGVAALWVWAGVCVGMGVFT